jgi:hypothetical protein
MPSASCCWRGRGDARAAGRGERVARAARDFLAAIRPKGGPAPAHCPEEGKICKNRRLSINIPKCTIAASAFAPNDNEAYLSIVLYELSILKKGHLLCVQGVRSDFETFQVNEDYPKSRSELAYLILSLTL